MPQNYLFLRWGYRVVEMAGEEVNQAVRKRQSHSQPTQQTKKTKPAATTEKSDKPNQKKTQAGSNKPEKQTQINPPTAVQ